MLLVHADTFDVYVATDGRVRLIDFNPVGFTTQPLSFSWQELGYGEPCFMMLIGKPWCLCSLSACDSMTMKWNPNSLTANAFLEAKVLHKSCCQRPLHLRQAGVGSVLFYFLCTDMHVDKSR